MKFSLRQLQVFSQTARFGNISRAADSLFLSQSAASTALKELENHYQTKLFDRIGKRLQLNETGKSIRPMVEELLANAEALEKTLDQESTLGELKIGATQTIGNYLVADIMVDFLNSHPNAKLDLTVANTTEVAEKILGFELDLALIEGDINHPELVTEHWLNDQLTIFAAPNHPLITKPAITEADLLATPWILREQGSGTRQIMERGLGSTFGKLNILLEIDQTQAIKQAVKHGLGIGCLSELALAESFENGSLAPLPYPDADLSRNFYILRHKQKFLTQGMKLWLTHVFAHSNA